MDSSTISADKFAVSSAEAFVSGSVTYDASSFTATYTPSSNLNYNTTYTVTVSASVEDLAGNQMQRDHSFSFKTRDLFNYEILPTGVTTIDFYSIASGSTGKAYISFGGDRQLKYLTNQSGSWSITTIDPGAPNIMAIKNSLAIDSAGKAHIVYQYFSGTELTELNYATNQSGSWVTTTISTQASTGGSESGIPIQVDASNKVHIGFWDDNSVKYLTNKTGSWVESIVTTAVSGAFYHPEMVLDLSGKVHFCFYNNDRLIYANNVSGSWQTEDIDSLAGIKSRYPSIAVDSNGKAHIAYGSNIDLNLKYATNSSGTWVITILDSGADTGISASISIDSDDKVHIVHIGGIFASIKYINNVDGPFKTYTSKYSGNSIDLVVDANRKVHICGSLGLTPLVYLNNVN